MATYSKEDVNAALEQGLISNEDAQYLSDALESSAPVGALAGGGLGATGGGTVGNIQGNNLLNKLAQKENLLPPKQGKIGKALDIGAGALLGGGIGAGLGSLVAPGSSGEGVQAEDSAKNKALLALMDPNTPPEVKRQIMDALQAKTSPPYGAMAGAGLGAAATGLGSDVGQQLLQKSAERQGLNLPTISGKERALSAGLGALSGAVLGGGVGNLIAPGTSNEDALLAALQEGGEQETGMPWGGIGGGLAGAASGGLAGLQAMKKLGGFAPRSLGGILGGSTGVGAGAGIGAQFGNLLIPATPYQNPLGEPNPQEMADGGMVGIDKVPAMLDRNEYVLPRDTTAAIGVNNLDRIKTATHNPYETALRRSKERMQNPFGMADGGVVGGSTGGGFGGDVARGLYSLLNRKQELLNQENQALGLPTKRRTPPPVPAPPPIDEGEEAAWPQPQNLIALPTSIEPSPYKDTRSWGQKYLGY